MAIRERSDGISIQTFLREAENGLSSVGVHTAEEVIASTMAMEGKRLDDFFWSAVFAADKILDASLITKLASESWYYGPPIPRPESRLRPQDKYFKQLFQRRAPTELISDPNFRSDLFLPKPGHSAALELGARIYLPLNGEEQTLFNLTFNVNYDDTLVAFAWMLREWRRPIGQLLRGVTNLELWGNGTTIDGPKDSRCKDPVFLLEYHLAQPKHSDFTPNLFSLRSSFSADHTDEDVVNTCAVFLSLFDSVYHLTSERANPDRLLKHYHTLRTRIPKAAFRATSVFSKNGAFT